MTGTKRIWAVCFRHYLKLIALHSFQGQMEDSVFNIFADLFNMKGSKTDYESLDLVSFNNEVYIGSPIHQNSET